METFSKMLLKSLDICLLIYLMTINLKKVDSESKEYKQDIKVIRCAYRILLFSQIFQLLAFTKKLVSN